MNELLRLCLHFLTLYLNVSFSLSVKDICAGNMYCLYYLDLLPLDDCCFKKTCFKCGWCL